MKSGGDCACSTLGCMKKPALWAVMPAADVSRIVEMAWEDRTPFEAIEIQFGLNEAGVVDLMRAYLSASSFRMWRKRMKGRVTKHAALRPEGMNNGARHVARHRIPQR